MHTIENYIAGQFHAPASGQYLNKTNPATGEVIARVPDSDARDVEAAVAAARQAFPAWARTPAAERCRLFLEMARKIEENLEGLAVAGTNDSGKPLRLSRTVDIPRASTNLRFRC